MFRTLALTSVLVVCLCSGQRNFGRNNDRSQDSRFRPTLQRPPPVNDLPIFEPYNPEKAPQVPIRLGERRCDNIYHGLILPCLLRPELPPYSYSTETMYNTEYKKK